ncbi:MAG TPA: SDR family oxidoreductase [Pyrinomonadaceae bacterium]|nr:SDR family oxidoreductase [Pyrinomonadaceae bacterium]
MSVILITGCSTGIGMQTALDLASQGHQVYASMRNVESGGAELREQAGQLSDSKGSVELCQMDVCDDRSVRNCVESLLEQEGRIDVLVNNAGIGPMGPIEEASDETVTSVFDTNVFGVLRVSRAVLPAMRRQGSGLIINVSSVAGRIGAGGMGIYSASKFALEGLSEALAQEVRPFGIKVAIIEPGFIKTPIQTKVMDSLGPQDDSAYPHIVERMRALFTMAQQVGGPTDLVSQTISEAITSPEVQLRYPVGDGARSFLEGRQRMTDHEWVEMGRHTDLESYFKEFGERFPPA